MTIIGYIIFIFEKKGLMPLKAATISSRAGLLFILLKYQRLNRTKEIYGHLYQKGLTL